ncbi:MAG: hypothetical protein JSW20_13280 [Nitrospiraceae bacterium]|nr:MAG: hypothetical protein JSW20_13280 [Nitrospiraceae bacterium]
MNTSKKTWVEKMLLTAKSGAMVLGMISIIFVPQMLQSAYAKAHSNHFHAFSIAAGYLAEQQNKINEQGTYAKKDADSKNHIVIASDEKTEMPCPRNTDADDNR